MSERGDALGAEEDDRNVIVGMGPGGLVAALELAEAGHRVLILEKREHFTRGQKVKLTFDTAMYLVDARSRKDYPEGEDFTKETAQDDAFLDELEKEGGIIEISKIQDYLKRQLKKYPELIEEKQSADGVKIEVIGVTPKNNTLTYMDGVHDEPQEVRFKHLIAADGAAHTTATMAGVPENEFKTNASQPRQEVHGAMTLELKKDVVLREKERELNFGDLSQLQGEPFYWDKPYLPRVYVWPDKAGKIYMGGEVPSACLKLKGEAQQKALESWAKIILEKTYGYKKNETGLNLSAGENPEETARNKLKATAFQVTLKHVDASVYECDEENLGAHAFVQIGDASRNANFFISHGTNDAIQDGIAVAKCMKGNLFDTDEFQERHEKVRDEIVAGTNTISHRDRHGYAEFDRKGKLLKTLGYSELTNENKQQFKTVIANIKKDILPCITDKKQRAGINEKIKQIESLGKENKYGEVLKAAEEVFDDVYNRITQDVEHFSKIGFCEKVSNWFHSFGKAAAKHDMRATDNKIGEKIESRADKAMTKKIESRLGMLYQFRATAESLDALAKLNDEKLKLGERPPLSATAEPLNSLDAFKKLNDDSGRAKRPPPEEKAAQERPREKP